MPSRIIRFECTNIVPNKLTNPNSDNEYSTKHQLFEKHLLKHVLADAVRLVYHTREQMRFYHVKQE